MTRIIVTGSRDWPDGAMVVRLLVEMVQAMHDPAFDPRVRGAVPRPGLVIVHGGGGNVDLTAGNWAFSFRPVVTTERYPYPRLLGSRGGPLRNEYMVGLGADACLAVIGPCTRGHCARPGPHGSHGASHCADLAERHGISTRWHETWR